MILSNCVLRFGSVKLEHLWLWTKHTRLHPCSPLLYVNSLHTKVEKSCAGARPLPPALQRYHTHCLSRLCWHPVGRWEPLWAPAVWERAASFADLTLQPFSSAGLRSRPPSAQLFTEAFKWAEMPASTSL